MDGQSELFPTKPLHEAVRPRGNRDDHGVMGESLERLADALKKHCPSVNVNRDIAPGELWGSVDDCIKRLSAEESFRNNHAGALSRLEELASK